MILNNIPKKTWQFLYIVNVTFIFSIVVSLGRQNIVIPLSFNCFKSFDWIFSV